MDAEFGRLYRALDRLGILADTWLVLTSDHGEMFERGIRGHTTPTLFQPVVHIPLLIFEPGQAVRRDVYEPTSAVDLLATLLAVTGQSEKVPDWTDGRVLPPFAGGSGRRAEAVFSVESKTLKPNQPMTVGTVAMVEDGYKLIDYFGYPELGGPGERVELYDLRADPGELVDLAGGEEGRVEAMRARIKAEIARNDAPFSL